jgi:arylsulfatase A-like enzyme
MKKPQFCRNFINCVFLFGLLLLNSCNFKNNPPPNLLIITTDTTRADRVGCYGYKQALTPNIDELAANGVRLQNAISCVPLTLPSHTTIFTGLIPPAHGVRVNAENGLSKNIPTLAEILQTNNYVTGAVISSTVLDSSFGLNRGFTYYSDNLSLSSNVLYLAGNKVADRSIAWLETIKTRHKDQNWFLWSHFFDPHEPVSLHKEFANAVNNNAYDSEIAYMDKQIGRIVKWLCDHDEFENTIIVVVGDHGEGLGDHNEDTHAFYIYQSTQHVPCIFTWKKKLPTGKILEPHLSLADLMPTLLELMRAEIEIYKPASDPRNATLKSNRDRSFAKHLLAPDKPLFSRPCYMESLWGFHMLNWAPLFGLIDQNHKFIMAPDIELYNLTADPTESCNIYNDFKRLADEMSITLEELEKSIVQPEITHIQLSQQKLNLIKSLGYAAGGSGIARTTADIDLAVLKDPKNHTEIANLQNKAHTLRTTHPSSKECLNICKQLIELQPDASIFHVWLGDCHQQRGEYNFAADAYQQAIKLDSKMFLAYNGFAMATAERGEIQAALQLFRKAYDLRPVDIVIQENIVKALILLADKAYSKNETEQALKLCHEALRLDPDNQAVKMLLSKLQ